MALEWLLGGDMTIWPQRWRHRDGSLIASDWLHRRLILTEKGIFSRELLRRRIWRWDEVAALSWDTGWRSAFLLAVCVRGDPWVKHGAPKWMSASVVQALLEEA